MSDVESSRDEMVGRLEGLRELLSNLDRAQDNCHELCKGETAITLDRIAADVYEEVKRLARVLGEDD